ncbi:MAG: CbtB domain-containing protein [Anaerolineales bacterium]
MTTAIRTSLADRTTLLLLVAAGLAFLLLLYVVGLDQGGLLSLVQGDIAYAQNLIHELTHDARHTAGFPCH